MRRGFSGYLEAVKYGHRGMILGRVIRLQSRQRQSEPSNFFFEFVVFGLELPVLAGKIRNHL